MRVGQKTLGRLALLGTLGLALGAGACAHVGQQDFDDGMAALRADMVQQMQDGDDALAGRLGARMDGIEGRLQALEQDLAALENEFGMTVERLETALRFNTPVHFGFDDATLDAADQEVLSRFGQVARDYYPDALITVEGFTDPSGSAAYNLRLGQRRADAVKAYLVGSAGFPGDRVKAVSYGEDTKRLVASGARGPGQTGWENRRVVLVIDHNGMAPAAATVAAAPGL